MPRSRASSSPQSVSVRRRSVIVGAAWATPVILAATSVPAYALSEETLTLTFDSPSYVVSGCAALTGVTVTATRPNGAPAMGKSLTVQAPPAYTFPNGTSTYTDVTDTSGVLALPALTAPAVAQNSSLVAISGDSMGSASLSLTPTVNNYVVQQNGSTSWSYGSLPSASRPIGAGFSMVGADLWYHNASLSADKTSAAGYIGPGPDDFCDVVKPDGGGERYQANRRVETYPNVPAGATAVGSRFFLASGGYLWRRNVQIISGVASAAGNYNSSGYDYATVVYSGGGGALVQGDAVQTTYSTVPAGSRALRGGYFLDPSKQLRFGDTVVTAVPASFAAYTNQTGANRFVAVVGTNGGATVYRNGVEFIQYSAIPQGATALGADYFLAPSGMLWYKNAPLQLGTYADAFIGADGQNYCIYAPFASC